MKKSDIYEIAIKLLGLYLFFKVIELLNHVITACVLYFQTKNNPQLFGNFDQKPLFILSIVNLVLVILFASLLTFKTKMLVKLVCKPDDYTDTASLFADRKVIYEMALLIMGLFTVVWALPDFIFQIKNYLQLKDSLPDNDNSTNFILQSGIKIVIGLVAIVYANVLAKLFVRNNKNTIDNNQ